MNYRNPTSLQIGQTGTFAGKTWRVAGRAVLGVVDDGGTYYWHEFNLETDAGESATLVYEKTDTGVQWRVFVQFQPEYPMTAADAASREVGDLINLEGTDVRVTLIDSSQVYFVEGKAPEGEVAGTRADYFNAESGSDMIVVSWTGDQVEYYRGQTISQRQIREAFNLPHSPDLPGVPSGGLNRYDLRGDQTGASTWETVRPLLQVAGALVVVATMIGLIIFTVDRHHGGSSGVKRFAAPLATLKLGASGTVGGTKYHITGHVLEDVAEVNLQYGRHEYFLTDQQGGAAMLLSNFHARDSDWFLFTPLTPAAPLRPVEAAAVKLGQIVSVDKTVVPVTALFMSTVRSSEFEGPSPMEPGESGYGFAGQRDDQYVLVRWNAGSIAFLKGHPVSSRSVQAAFTQ